MNEMKKVEVHAEIKGKHTIFACVGLAQGSTNRQKQQRAFFCNDKSETRD